MGGERIAVQLQVVTDERFNDPLGQLKLEGGEVPSEVTANTAEGTRTDEVDKKRGRSSRTVLVLSRRRKRDETS